MLVYEISKGYRSARRNTSILCALALSWSAAQIDFQTLVASPIGTIDISRAVIPLLFFFGVVYATGQLILEYAMQCVEVRRWRYAQYDLKLTVLLVRVTILVLAASGLHRSIEVVMWTIIAVTGVAVSSLAAIALGAIALTPLMIHIRMRQGRYSVAPRVFEAAGWSIVIICFTIIIFLAWFGYASVHYEPLRALWPVPPTPFSLWIFIAACIGILGSILYQGRWYRKLFADPQRFIEKALPNGKIGVTFLNNVPKPVCDWYIQPISKNGPALTDGHLDPTTDSSKKDKAGP